VRELGVNAREEARRMKLTQPAVSISVKRGDELPKRNAL